MVATAHNRSSHWWTRWWLVPLLVAGLMVAVGVFAVQFVDSTHDSSDGERLVKMIFGGDWGSHKEIRSQIGEERFWRAIRSCIRGRPSDLEVRFRDWLRLGAGSPNVFDSFRSSLEKNWEEREIRLRASLGIINMELREAATSALPELIGLAQSNNFDYASQGLQTLSTLGVNGLPSLPVLLNRLEQSGRNLGPSIVETVSHLDPQGVHSAARVVSLLPMAAEETQIAMLRVLGQFSQRQPELATNLWAALLHTNLEVASSAIYGLSIGEQLTAERLEPYRAGFHSDDARARWQTLHLIASAGPNAGGFVSELREVALCKSPEQPTAMNGLRGVLSAPALPVEQRLAAAEAIIASDSGQDAWEVLEQLTRIGSSTPQLVSLITIALGHPNERMRAKAAEALGNLGSAARPALPQLRALQHDEWKMVRDAVELAVPKIGE